MGYIELKKLLESGKVKLLLMGSTPRKRTTALQLTLAQAPEVAGQINAPLSNEPRPVQFFYHDNTTLKAGTDLRTFDSACDKIIATATELLEKNAGSGAMNPMLLDFPLPITTPRLLIRPPQLGHGLGKQLMNAFVQQFLLNFSAVIVDPEPHNTHAIRCYEQCGFQKSGYTETNNSLIMIKNITPKNRID